MRTKKPPLFSDKPNRTLRTTTEERDSRFARIKDYGAKYQVEMTWDKNEACRQDRIIQLSIGGHEAYLDVEELQRYLRWS